MHVYTYMYICILLIVYVHIMYLTERVYLTDCESGLYLKL